MFKRYIFIGLLVLSLVGCQIEESSEIEITIPDQVMYMEGMTKEELTDKAKASDGVLDVSEDEDGQLIIRMESSEHRKLMEDLDEENQGYFNEMINSEETSIVEIDREDDYSSIDVYVDPSRYDESETFIAPIFYSQATRYRALNGEEDLICIIRFIDQESGEVLFQEDSSDFLAEISSYEEESKGPGKASRLEALEEDEGSDNQGEVDNQSQENKE